MEDEERREVISEFLQEATEKPVEPLVDELLRRNANQRERIKAQEEEQRQKELEAAKRTF